MSDELVLGLPAARLRELGTFTGFTTDTPRYLPALFDAKHLSFRPRGDCETDPTWLQLIPYVVLQSGDRIFHYTRGSKGGEKRLHALKSIGIGGHINPVDTEAADPYRAGLARELAEEIHLGCAYIERVLGLVYDPSTPVGSVHLGVVHLLTLENDDITPRDQSLAACGLARHADLKRDAAQFETWSQLVLAALTHSR
jgi:predicted NUDIX family phosphoesterase